jgi:hypothetical protein
MPTNLTGAEPRSTPRPSRLKRGRGHRPEPDGSRQTGHEAPCCGRPDGHTARLSLSGPTGTTASCWRPPSMRCRRCVMGGDVPGADLTSCTPTRPTTIAAAARNADSVPLCPGLPAAVWTSASAWDDIDGWWSAQWRGSTASVASPFAMTDARTSTGLHHTRMRAHLLQPMQTVLLGALSAPGTPRARYRRRVA